MQCIAFHLLIFFTHKLVFIKVVRQILAAVNTNGLEEMVSISILYNLDIKIVENGNYLVRDMFDDNISPVILKPAVIELAFKRIY